MITPETINKLKFENTNNEYKSIVWGMEKNQDYFMGNNLLMSYLKNNIYLTQAPERIISLTENLRESDYIIKQTKKQSGNCFGCARLFDLEDLEQRLTIPRGLKGINFLYVNPGNMLNLENKSIYLLDKNCAGKNIQELEVLANEIANTESKELNYQCTGNVLRLMDKLINKHKAEQVIYVPEVLANTNN